MIFWHASACHWSETLLTFTRGNRGDNSPAPMILSMSLTFCLSRTKDLTTNTFFRKIFYMKSYCFSITKNVLMDIFSYVAKTKI